mgnify:CR=1 FL=1
MISGVQWITFTAHGDSRGSLIAIENNKDIPFPIRRIYYIYGSSYDAVRGKHAHKDLNQVLICVSGSCDIFLDNGKEKETVHLDSRDKGIYIYGFIWREMMHFSEDCVLLALVDRPYDPEDYVFDHDQLLRLTESEDKK